MANVIVQSSLEKNGGNVNVYNIYSCKLAEPGLLLAAESRLGEKCYVS